MNNAGSEPIMPLECRTCWRWALAGQFFTRQPQRQANLVKACSRIAIRSDGILARSVMSSNRALFYSPSRLLMLTVLVLDHW